MGGRQRLVAFLEKLKIVFPEDSDPKIIKTLSDSKPTFVTTRTLEKWLAAITISVNPTKAEVLASVLSKKAGFTFESRWFECPLPQFQSEFAARKSASHAPQPTLSSPAPASQEVSGSVTSLLTIDISRIRNLRRYEHILCGKFHLYHYSFTNSGDIVREVVSVSPIEGQNREFNVTMYCHPADRHSQLKAHGKAAAVQQAAHEEFRGKLFGLGTSFYIICSVGRSIDARLRILHFPILDAPVNLHYGLLSSYSQTFREPVAVRVFARRYSRDWELAARDKKFVTRGGPNKPKGVSIPTAILGMLDNHIKGKQTVLLADQHDAADSSVKTAFTKRSHMKKRVRAKAPIGLKKVADKRKRHI